MFNINDNFIIIVKKRSFKKKEEGSITIVKIKKKVIFKKFIKKFSSEDLKFLLDFFN